MTTTVRPHNEKKPPRSSGCDVSDRASETMTERQEDGMKTTLLLLVASVCTASLILAAQVGAAEEYKMSSPDDIKWETGSPSLPAGAETVVLYGDPAKAGLFAIRLKLPKGITSLHTRVQAIEARGAQLNHRFDPGCYRIQHLGSDLGIHAPSARGQMKRMIGIGKQLQSCPRAESLDERL